MVYDKEGSFLAFFSPEGVPAVTLGFPTGDSDCRNFLRKMIGHFRNDIKCGYTLPADSLSSVLRKKAGYWIAKGIALAVRNEGRTEDRADGPYGDGEFAGLAEDESFLTFIVVDGIAAGVVKGVGFLAVIISKDDSSPLFAQLQDFADRFDLAPLILELPRPGRLAA
jgi:hypothetical protein